FLHVCSKLPGGCVELIAYLKQFRVPFTVNTANLVQIRFDLESPCLNVTVVSFLDIVSQQIQWPRLEVCVVVGLFSGNLFQIVDYEFWIDTFLGTRLEDISVPLATKVDAVFFENGRGAIILRYQFTDDIFLIEFHDIFCFKLNMIPGS